MAFEIKNGVFERYTEEDGVTEVVIPEGVTKIRMSAFYGCKNLKSVTIPEGVTEIDWHVFKNCTSLRRYDNRKGNILRLFKP